MNSNLPPAVSDIEGKNPRSLFPFLVLILLGVVVSAMFSGLWYLPVVHKVWGIQRFWFDVSCGSIYFPVILLYVAKVIGVYKIIRSKQPKEAQPISFKAFVLKHPWIIRLGILLAVGLILSIFLTLATGLVLVLAVCCHRSWRRHMVSSMFEVVYRKSSKEIDPRITS